MKKTSFLLALVVYLTFGFGAKTSNFENARAVKMCSGNIYSEKNAFLETAKTQGSSKNSAALSPINSGLWYQSSIWPNGVLPSATDDVVVPQGITLTLAGTCKAKSITVYGILNAVNWQAGGAWINLETKYIMVSGSLAQMEIGTATTPYQSTEGAVLTFLGTDTKELIPGTTINSKGILVTNGGALSLHGEKRTSWVKMGAKALVGASSVTLAQAVDWSTGEEIVITSNRLNPAEAEIKTITNVSADKKTISFSTPLQYPRMGELKNYSSLTKTWAVDTRAEVGLFTRKIKIQGDASSNTNGFGAHIMMMDNAKGNADNVEFTLMGQKASLGRYPWHWHLLGDKGNGQYFTNNSMRTSYNRAITIHGTWGTKVDNNLVYEHVGHGIFLEDGSEINNTISKNLVLLTKRAAAGENLLDTDRDPFLSFQNAAPSSFWITNPNNIIVDNIVAGSEGTAYWFIFPQNPTGDSQSDPRFQNMEPVKTPLKQFDRNTAHSCIQGLDINDRVDANHKLQANGAWSAPGIATFNDLVFFSNYFSLYAGIGDQQEDVVYNNIISTDAKVHVNFATHHIVQNSLFIADTDNGLLDINYANVDFLKSDPNVYLYRLYDGAGRMYNNHYINWNRDYTSFFRNNGAAEKRINHRFSGCTYNHPGPPTIFTSPAIMTGETATRCIQVWNNVVYDLDGSITRTGVANSIVTDMEFNRLKNPFKPANWTNVLSVSDEFVYLRFKNMPMSVATKDLSCGATRVFNTSKCELGGVVQLHLPLDHTVYEHTMYLPSDSLGTSLGFTLQSAPAAGRSFFLILKGFGSYTNVKVNGFAQVGSANLVRSTATESYYVQPNGDLYVKLITVAPISNRSVTISWTGGTKIDESVGTSQAPVNQFSSIVSAVSCLKKGEVKFSFPNHPNKTGVQFSTDGGASFSPIVNDNLGSYTIGSLTEGTYNLVARWNDKTCPMSETKNILFSANDCRKWEFTTDGDLERWSPDQLTLTAMGGFLTYKIDGGDSKLTFVKGLEAIANDYKFLRVRIKTAVNGQVELFWGRTDAPNFAGTRYASINVTGNVNFQEVLIPLASKTEWKNTIDQLRIDLQFPIGQQGQVDLISLEQTDLRDCAGVWQGGAAQVGGSCVISTTDEILSNLNLSVFPNPSETGIYNLSDNVSYRVFNLSGQLIKTGKGETIELTGFPKGVYILHANGHTIKLVK
jgi:hypothetical protein